MVTVLWFVILHFSFIVELQIWCPMHINRGLYLLVGRFGSPYPSYYINSSGILSTAKHILTDLHLGSCSYVLCIFPNWKRKNPMTSSYRGTATSCKSANTCFATNGMHFGIDQIVRNSGYDEPNLAANKYNPLGTRFVIRWWKKKQRIANCRTMTMRYGIILEDGIETFLDSGCRATSFIQTMKTEFSHNINWKIPITASINNNSLIVQDV